MVLRFWIPSYVIFGTLKVECGRTEIPISV